MPPPKGDTKKPRPPPPQGKKPPPPPPQAKPPPKEGDKTVPAQDPVWKSNSVSGAPDNSSLSHFSAMTRPSWLGRAARNRHRHAIEQASR